MGWYDFRLYDKWSVEPIRKYRRKPNKRNKALCLFKYKEKFWYWINLRLDIKWYAVQIGKTSLGTYKIVYEHPIQKSKDIYLIIMILNSKEIYLKTIYKANRTRRIREYEPK